MPGPAPIDPGPRPPYAHTGPYTGTGGSPAGPGPHPCARGWAPDTACTDAGTGPYTGTGGPPAGPGPDTGAGGGAPDTTAVARPGQRCSAGHQQEGEGAGGKQGRAQGPTGHGQNPPKEADQGGFLKL